MNKIIIGIGAIIIALVLVGSYLLVPALIYDGSMTMESESMSHPDGHRHNGIIDINDIVHYNSVDNIGEIVTYVDGQATDYMKYGSYGDVIIYRPNGLTDRLDGTEVMPIIHRPIVWLEINASQVNSNFDGIDYANYTFDVPSLGQYSTNGNIVLDCCIIELDSILKYFEWRDMVPHGGFITMGDHNAPYFDQPLSGSYEPVLLEWIVGKVVHLRDK